MHKPPYIIYCNQAMAVYQALGIEKKRIDKGQDWRFYGERGLAHEQVTVWVYEGTLKLEYQAVTLSKYHVELQDDRRHIQGVSHPRIAQTPFRSPLLTLFDLGPDEWRVYWHVQPYTFRQRKRPTHNAVQLALFEIPEQEKAVEGDVIASSQARLRLIPPSQEEE